MSIELQYRDRPPRSSSEGAPACLVLLHGYGSNELDLLGLADSLDPRLHVVSLRAPIAIGPQQFAWFDLDWQSGQVIPDQEQALQVRTTLIYVLRQLPERIGAQDRLLLAGFSQGAMLTLGVALEAPEILQRIAMMSGAVLPRFVPEETSTNLNGLPALVQHGLGDTVLPAAGSRQAAELLGSLGAQVQYAEYAMGHEVSLESLRDLKGFLVPGA